MLSFIVENIVARKVTSLQERWSDSNSAKEFLNIFIQDRDPPVHPHHAQNKKVRAVRETLSKTELSGWEAVMILLIRYAV